MTEETRTIPIAVRIPAILGLTRQEINTLETKWQEDLTKAADTSGEKLKIKWSIKINIEIGNA